MGYADGYRRLFSGKPLLTLPGRNGGPSRAFAVVGRVSMDQINIDLTDAGHVDVGEEVTVIDDSPSATNSVEALAELAGSIPYEITTMLGRRVLRVAAP